MSKDKNPQISAAEAARDAFRQALAAVMNGEAEPELSKALVSKGEVPQIVVPQGMTYLTASKHLKMKHEEESRIVSVDRHCSVLPWAGAHAVSTVLSKIDARRGETYEVKTPFGRQHHTSEEVQVPLSDRTVPVFWGNYEVAGIGELKMWKVIEYGSYVLRFGVTIECEQRLRKKAEALLAEIIEEAETNNLYHRTCIALAPDEDGDLVIGTPPKVYPTPTTLPKDLILNSDTQRQVSAELFTPILQRTKLTEMGAGGSRGILLAGRPGTGKTLTARIATNLALQSGWSAFYLPDARALETALALASIHSPAILICEDLDRQLAGDRTTKVDRILNALDGLDKSKEVIFIATTNDDKELPAALLRPGRLHSLISFEPADEEAAARLLRLNLGSRAPEVLDQAAKECVGFLPAAVEEVARRSILHAVEAGREQPDDEDLASAAIGVRKHQQRLEEAEKARQKPRPGYDVHVFDEGRKLTPDEAASVAPVRMTQRHEVNVAASKS